MVIDKGIPVTPSTDLSTENLPGQKGVAGYIQSAKRKKKTTPENTLPNNVIIQNWRRGRVFQNPEAKGLLLLRWPCKKC